MNGMAVLWRKQAGWLRVEARKQPVNCCLVESCQMKPNTEQLAANCPGSPMVGDSRLKICSVWVRIPLGALRMEGRGHSFDHNLGQSHKLNEVGSIPASAINFRGKLWYHNWFDKIRWYVAGLLIVLIRQLACGSSPPITIVEGLEGSASNREFESSWWKSTRRTPKGEV